MSLDFVAGCIGGCAGLLVGYPLDTIKVHLQTQDSKNPIYKGTWDCMKTLYKKEKLRGLYRGISSPMAGMGFVNAIVFGVYGNVQRHTEHPDSLRSHCLAGATAGLFQSIVCAPMELAKTIIQLQQDTGTGVKYRGPSHCMLHILRADGIRGVFKGLGITAARDVPGFASYFVSYEFMMSLPSKPNAMHSLLAGGLAGICSWIVCYPTDVVKTSLQGEALSANPKYKGTLDCMQKGYKSEGIYFFFRGLSSTLLRAFPMNAACFFVVTLIMRFAEPSKTDEIAYNLPCNMPLQVVDLESICCNMQRHECKNGDMEHKRYLRINSLKMLRTLNEAGYEKYETAEDVKKPYWR